MKRRTFLGASALLPMFASARVTAMQQASKAAGLADAFKDDFFVGAAISTDTLMQDDQQLLGLIDREFSSVTAENCQKWEEIHPAENQWNWEASDKFIEFGTQHNKHILGHTLVWHSQIPASVFTGDEGLPITAKALLGRMENHINTLVDRYRGKVNTWDVVNEVVSDNGYGSWRKSPWFNILGKDFMEHAFRTAAAADPNAELLYNDYNMHYPAKRGFLTGVLADYLDRGVPINGVGFQAHYSLEDPELDEIEKSIETYAEMGLKLHFTELDVDVLPKAFDYMGAEISTNFEYSEKLNPYPDELPAMVQEKLAERYAKLFALFVKHRDVIERVTTWGVTDAHSWKNDWPVKGRQNYPLLFDREAKPKAAYHAIRRLKQT
ncbi:endo-1,4-beta-xylanase [Arenicella xantha]|nr:endo-1,4-beta-xylanase [Arenicella xantha]